LYILYACSFVSLPRFLVLFTTALAISAGTWAAQQLFFSPKLVVDWKTGLVIGIFAYGVAHLINLIVSIISGSAAKRSFALKAMDNYLLLLWLDVYHLLTVHKKGWGEASYQKDLTSQLGSIANTIEHYLPTRLAITGGGGHRRERKACANAASQAIRSRLKYVLLSDGRLMLRQTVNKYLPLTYRGAWLELPQEVAPSPARGLIKISRSLIASLIPAALMLCLGAAKIVTGNYETYGWLFASLWFAVSIGTLLDPGLADRLKVMTNMIAVFRGSEGDDTVEMQAPK
jgi:hypothetical protein